MGKLVQDMLFGGNEAFPPKRSEERAEAPKRKAEMVRVAPGVHGWVPKDAAAVVGEYILCRWSRQQNGTYAPIPVGGTFEKLTPALCETLGWAGGLDTLKRLAVAGFVDAPQVSPGVTLLDLDSWARHLAECMEDPDRWSEGSEDLNEYLFKNGLRHHEDE